MNILHRMITIGALAIPAFAAMMDGVTLIYTGGGMGGSAKSILYGPDQSTILNQWAVGGYSVHFSDSGTIFYTSGFPSNVSGCNTAAGYGSIVEMRWDSTIVRTITSAQLGGGGFHHAFTLTKKGTILAIALENYNGGCGEKLVEYDPNLGQVIWEWHTNDHVGTNNAAKVPQKSGQDPYHVNGVDLDPDRNLIVFSAHNTFEVYVVDHSTTTQQAAGTTGGTFGQGGDILFRFGYPSNYGISGGLQYISTAVHSPRWVPKGYPGEGNIVLFANKSPQSTNSYATGYEVRPFLSGTTFAKKASGEFDYEILFAGVGSATTTNMGGMDKLPNGNWLVTYVNSNKAAEYEAGTVNQSIANAVKTWSAGSSNGIRRYPLCHLGLAKIAETRPAVAAIYDADACDAFGYNPTPSSSAVVGSSSGTTSLRETAVLTGVSLQQKANLLQISGLKSHSQVRILNVVGQVQYQGVVESDHIGISTVHWIRGTYLVQVRQGSASWTQVVRIIS